MISTTDIRAILQVAVGHYADYLAEVVRPEELPFSDSFWQTVLAMHRVASTIRASDLVQDSQQIIAPAVAMMERAGLGDQV